MRHLLGLSEEEQMGERRDSSGALQENENEGHRDQQMVRLAEACQGHAIHSFVALAELAPTRGPGACSFCRLLMEHCP